MALLVRRKPACHPHRPYHAKDMCKECYTADYYPRQLAATRTWATKQGPVWRFDRYLKRTYGITIDDYYEMLKAQKNRCGICETLEPGGNKMFFCVDHCHETLIIRGLLCDSCNRGIGCLKDSVRNLRRAISYLKRGGYCVR